jgi:hypothetical protein
MPRSGPDSHSKTSLMCFRIVSTLLTLWAPSKGILPTQPKANSPRKLSIPASASQLLGALGRTGEVHMALGQEVRAYKQTRTDGLIPRTFQPVHDNTLKYESLLFIVNAALPCTGTNGRALLSFAVVP